MNPFLDTISAEQIASWRCSRMLIQTHATCSSHDARRACSRRCCHIHIVRQHRWRHHQSATPCGTRAAAHCSDIDIKAGPLDDLQASPAARRCRMAARGRRTPAHPSRRTAARRAGARASSGAPQTAPSLRSRRCRLMASAPMPWRYRTAMTTTAREPAGAYWTMAALRRRCQMRRSPTRRLRFR